MPDKGVFVDDEDGQYAALLSTRGVLEFEYQSVVPIMDQALAIRHARPTVVALDYRLDEVTPEVAADQTYKGSGLAQVLRDAAIAEPAEDFAIVLVSGEMKLEALYAPDKTAHDLFDRVYTKEEVTNDRARVKREAVALSEGYKDLRAMGGRYEPVSILAAREDERARVCIQEIAIAFDHAAAPHILSKLVLHNFIERPGLLVDCADAAALLGLAEDSFETIASALVEAGTTYEGLFSSGWRRWWTHRIEEWGEGLLDRSLTALDAGTRAAGLSAKLGLDLRPARSPWNGEETEFISFACASCRRPAEMRHSLAAFDPRAPKFAARRRICWDCIQTDRYLEPTVRLMVEETDADLIDEVKRRERRG